MIVKVSREFFAKAFTPGPLRDLFADSACVEGLPDGADLRDVRYNGFDDCVDIYFAHPSEKDGDLHKIVDVRYERAVAT